MKIEPSGLAMEIVSADRQDVGHRRTAQIAVQGTRHLRHITARRREVDVPVLVNGAGPGSRPVMLQVEMPTPTLAADRRFEPFGDESWSGPQRVVQPVGQWIHTQLSSRGAKPVTVEIDLAGLCSPSPQTGPQKHLAHAASLSAQLTFSDSWFNSAEEKPPSDGFAGRPLVPQPCG